MRRSRRRINQRTRRERAHAAGVRPFVVVEDALVILRGTERNGAPAVAEGEEGHFRTGQALLEHDARARGSEASLFHRLADRIVSGAGIGGDDNALSRGQAVSLDDDRQAELASIDDGMCRCSVLAHAIARRRHAVTRHERFRKDLAALETRRGLGGTEDRESG